LSAIVRIGRTVIPGVRMSQITQVIPLCLGEVGPVRTSSSW